MKLKHTHAHPRLLRSMTAAAFYETHAIDGRAWLLARIVSSHGTFTVAHRKRTIQQIQEGAAWRGALLRRMEPLLWLCRVEGVLYLASSDGGHDAIGLCDPVDESTPCDRLMQRFSRWQAWQRHLAKKKTSVRVTGFDRDAHLRVKGIQQARYRAYRTGVAATE